MIFGRILGSTLGGYLTSGFAFGLIGGILGWYIGKYFDLGYKSVIASPEQVAEIQKTFFKATFSVMGFIAKADGQVTLKAIQYAETVMTHFKLTPSQRQEAIQLFRLGKTPGYSALDDVALLYKVAHTHRDVLQCFIDIQREIATIDGPMTATQQKVFADIGRVFEYHVNFGPTAESARAGTFDFNQKFKSQNAFTHAEPIDVQNAYRLLGLSPGTKFQVVKKTYYQLMTEYHPDKLISQGLPKEMMEFATQKVQKISNAYRLIEQYDSRQTNTNRSTV